MKKQSKKKKMRIEKTIKIRNLDEYPIVIEYFEGEISIVKKSSGILFDKDEWEAFRLVIENEF